jgi:CrcB protein
MDLQQKGTALDETPRQMQPVVSAKAPQARRRETVLLYGAIALGSIIGSVLRWLASLGAGAILGQAFPFGTLFVNVTGSFAIGFFAGLSGPGGRLFIGSRLRQFVMTGICGGYTTFSVFSLETLQLVQHGAILEAALNLAVSIVTWLGAVWFGDAVASRLNRLRGG